jgi:hydrogenase-4 component E
MPLVVEFAVAFSVVVALVVIWVFLFRLQQTFGDVDHAALDEFQGLRR